MKFVGLIENTAAESSLKAEHGLSVYIETEKHKLLVDTGASEGFLRNAESLHVDLKAVDSLILSHGHYDHGGGILAFARINPEAGIYIRENAFGEFYHVHREGTDYIGLNQSIRKLPQLVWVKGNMVLDEELSLYTQVEPRTLSPEGNKELRELCEGEYVQDKFEHEQYLVISSGGKEALISGCAHKGIVNIMEQVSELRGRAPDLVISGFHTEREAYKEQDIDSIQAVGRELKKYGSMYYTGHCTGEVAYRYLKEILGEQLQYFAGGTILELGLKEE